MTPPPVAIVTGASRGIGAAIARRFATEGFRVALLARSEAPLQALAAELGVGARAFPGDLTEASVVAHLAPALLEFSGGAPDALINNAGLFLLGAVGAMDASDFAAVLHTNLVAPFLLTHALLPAMRTRGRGDIVTIGSIADRAVYPENGAYAASKYGLRALHEVLRLETRGSGVRATLVSPGPVDTPLWDAVNPDVREGFTPRAAMLTDADVADAVWFTVSRPAHVTIDELRLSRS